MTGFSDGKRNMIAQSSDSKIGFTLKSGFQKYTQSNGRRPFGLSTLLIGFDYDGTPKLYQTDPSGTYHEWKVSKSAAGKDVRSNSPNVVFLSKSGFFLQAHFLYFVLLQANAIGRSAKTVREFLEKHYTEEVASTEKESVKLALKALLEVVQSGSKNMELAIMRRNEPLKVCSSIAFDHFSVSVGGLFLSSPQKFNQEMKPGHSKILKTLFD